MYYLTPKDLKEEARVIHETIKDVAGDLGGDINYLNDRLNEFEPGQGFNSAHKIATNLPKEFTPLRKKLAKMHPCLARSRMMRTRHQNQIRSRRQAA